MADYDGGRVFLQVIPSFRNVQRLIGAEAKKWGRAAGRDYANEFERETAKADAKIGPDTAEAKKDGARAGGAFADAFQKRIRAAVRSLPDVEVDADTDPAQRRIARLRADLERLSGQTVGVDIDTGTAMAELDRIDRELDEIGRDSAEVQVQADTMAARAQLSHIHAQVNDLDRDDVDINVDVDRRGLTTLNTFTGRLVALGTAGAALAPAIVPAAAAATAALAGIGTGALIGLGGIGTLALGFAGIGDAVKAMGEVQLNAASDAEDAARRQSAAAAQVASARRQVEAAEVGLANARRDAAWAAEDASRRVERARERVGQVSDDVADRVAAALRRQEDAERRLEDAQQQALDTQEALTRARSDAEDRIEDLALAVESGALRERDAVLGVHEARRRLDEVRSDPQATVLEQRRARLSYEQAVQQLEELRVRNQRLAEEHAAASRAGVEGSEEVVAARERIAEADQNVSDAEQTLTTAQEQVVEAREDGARRIADAQQAVADAVRASARQQQRSAQSIESAQRSLIGAQASLQQALQRTGDEGSTSMEKLDEAMAALSPAGQAFATFLFGLKPLWDDLRAAAQENLLPGVQRGIEALLPVMPQITDMVGSFAGALGDMFTAAGQAFVSPAWMEFFEYIAAVGPTILGQFGQIMGNVALGLTQLLLAFAPLTERFITGLVGMTEAFADWTSTLSETEGFQTFLQYVIDTAPAVLDFLGAIWRGFGAIFRAMAPFGPIVLGIVSAFATFLDVLPPGVLSAIALAVIGIVTAFNLLAPVIGVVVSMITAGLGSVIVPIAAVIAGVAAISGALIAAYVHSETFRNVVDTAFRAVGAVATWLWQEAIQPAFRGIAAVVTWTWNNVIWPALQLWWAYITNVLVPVITWLWKNIVEPHFRAIGQVISWTWTNVISPALAALDFYISEILAPTVMWLWKNVISPAWTGISTVIEVAWGAIKIIFATIKFYIDNILAPVFTWLWHNIVEPAFDGIGSVIGTAWRNVIRPVLRALGDFIGDTVVPAFQRGVDAIGKAWDRIRRLAAAPVNFVIETVYMGGIKPVFDKIASVVGADPLPVVNPITFGGGGPSGAGGRTPGLQMASGGVIPGYTPGRDVHRFYSPTAGMLELSGGEPVLRPEAGRVLGRGWVDGINAAARGGGIGGVRRWLGGYADGGLLSFAGGGILDRFGDLASMAREGIGSALSSVGRFVLGGLRSAADLALKPVRSIMGQIGDHPYADLLRGLVDRAIDQVLGFAGDKDAAGTLEGGSFSRDPGGWPPRMFGQVAANTAAAAQFVRETFGLGNIGMLGQRSNKSDHPFGKALDVMVGNWADPAGIGQGNQVASWFVGNPDVFGTKYVIWRDHINTGSGWRPYVHPSGNTEDPTLRHMDHVHVSLFDDGGWLPPGLSMVANMTGKPEPVLTDSQWGDLAAGRGDVHVYGTLVHERELVDLIRHLQARDNVRNGR